MQIIEFQISAEFAALLTFDSSTSSIESNCSRCAVNLPPVATFNLSLALVPIAAPENPKQLLR